METDSESASALATCQNPEGTYSQSPGARSHRITSEVSFSYAMSAGMASSKGEGLTVFSRRRYRFIPTVWTMNTSSAS